MRRGISGLRCDNQEKTKIEQKLDKLVDRLLDTDSPTLIKTYEKSIKQLEKQKVLLDEKLKVGRKRQPSFERAFKTALVWLTNPAVLWDTGCLADRKSLLKVLFTDNLRYDKESGFLNRPIAQPIRLCGLVGDGGTKMVGWRHVNRFRNLLKLNKKSNVNSYWCYFGCY
ncbi:MAG: hypothetical protein C9355_06015 [Thalassolituus maritimus]|nr:MAG: hypothetical protein C9355_06015 [Thalassolituus maritimus]